MPRIDAPPQFKGEQGPAGKGIIVSETQPATAEVGDIWVNPSGIPANLFSFSRFSVSFVFDGGELPIAPGNQATVTIPFDATLLGWRMVSPKQAGTLSVRLERSTFSEFPTFDELSYEAFGINNEQKQEVMSPPGWVTDVSENDILRAHVITAGVTTMVELTIFAERRQE